MIAAPERPEQYTEWFAQIFGLRESTRAAMQARIEAHHRVQFHQFDFTALAPKITSLTLVVHDVNDPLHPSVAARTFAESLKQGAFVETKGLGHTKTLRDLEITTQIVAFLR
jgi:pimeloyl-ACP methyl ester carboxylesterase